MATSRRLPTGIVERHSRECGSRADARCDCAPALEAWVYDARSKRKIRRTFTGTGALAAAKGWRVDNSHAIRKGVLKAPSKVTLRDSWESWQAGALEGTIRARSGDRYKPAVLRGYAASMRLHVLDELGARRLSDVTRLDLQDLADRMLAAGKDPSTIRNALMPLRAIYRRALSRGDVMVNPTTGLELPAPKGTRDRIATPAEASELLGALAEADHALWATAFYAGLRRGELRALRWENVDLDAGEIRVEAGYDEKEGLIEAKSKAGRRVVPIVAVLRTYLLAHHLRAGRPSTGFVFGGRDAGPFTPSAVRRRALTAWKVENVEREKREEEPLVPIGLHEARHTFASVCIAAGVNVKALSAYMGHSSVTITLDRYGHLMPGHAAEAVERIDAYLIGAAAVR